jgi:hypothetical protein
LLKILGVFKKMKRFSTLSMIMLIVMLISACGGGQSAEPTINPEDIQSTAVAAAFTIVAETQAAIPTNTPLPPTETASPTPLPTDTPIPSPTTDPLAVTATLVPTQQSSGGDPCNAPLGANVSGRPAKINLVNNTKGDLVVSLYLNKTAFGECGYRGYNIGPSGSTLITDLPQGCYNVSVFVTGPNKNTKAFGYGCINNTDKATFQLNAENVVFGE